MRRGRVAWRVLAGDRRGVTAVEYALIGMLIFLVIVTSVGTLGTAVQTLYQSIATAFTAA